MVHFILLVIARYKRDPPSLTQVESHSSPDIAFLGCEERLALTSNKMFSVTLTIFLYSNSCTQTRLLDMTQLLSCKIWAIRYIKSVSVSCKPL